jgi:outer membrane lipoprotein carrier protein
MRKFIAAFIALGIAAGAEAQSADAIMSRAAKTYSDMRSVRAEFTQTITNPLTGTSATSRGVLLRKDPNMLSIDFIDPKGDRVVSDGSTLWIYLPSSAPNQVIKTSAKSGGPMEMVDPTGVFLSSPASRFTISSGGTGTVAGRKMNVVTLVPRSKNGMFTRAKLWIDASTDMLRQLEVVDVNGLTRMVTITSISPNATISSGSFRFTPPKNARIVDSAAMGGN